MEFQRNYQQIGTKSPEWIDVADNIRRQWSRFDSGDVRLNINFDSFEVYADPLLGQAFYNLIHNALLYGKEVSRIEVSIDERGDETYVIFEDDGIGIPESDKENIFQRGYGQASGLGLYLVKEILKMSGFGIEEVGTPGEGARFEIGIPTDKCRP